MQMLACYLLFAAEIATPPLPSSCCYGDVLRDDHGGFLIVGEVWLGVGKVQPGGRAIHIVWTHRRNGAESFAYASLYSWDAAACQWRGYYGRAEDPYTVEETLRER